MKQGVHTQMGRSQLAGERPLPAGLCTSQDARRAR